MLSPWPAGAERVAGLTVAAASGEHPTASDAEQCLRLVTDLMSSAAVSTFAQALDVVWTTTNELLEQGSAFGLIHGDLHYENFMFHEGTAPAIDFDDCGWGFHLYDLAVTLWELEDRPRYNEMRTALLEEYSRLRPLPERHSGHLQALVILRRLQILMWILESREHVAFRNDWEDWANEDLARISGAVATLR